MLLVQEAGRTESEEELGPVGIPAVVGHGHDTAAGMADDEVLVIETAPVDADGSRPVACRDVATLDQKIFHQAMTKAVFEGHFLVLSDPAVAQRLEVEDGDGGGVPEEGDDHLAADVIPLAVVVLHLDLQRRLVRHREVLVAVAQRRQGR